MIDEGLLRGGIAVVSLVAFLGICWWAYRPKSRARFEADALLVFEDGEPVADASTGRLGSGAGARRGHQGKGVAA
ncbi:MAG: CcoQ/FixQ family Cbb3-type cytochrome c oxidase assembly chaperone [Myxococcota bacterium]